jgi:hypothetical protein
VRALRGVQLVLAAGDAMSVGFIRYDKGASNEWTVTYPHWTVAQSQSDYAAMYDSFHLIT